MTGWKIIVLALVAGVLVSAQRCIALQDGANGSPGDPGGSGGDGANGAQVPVFLSGDQINNHLYGFGNPGGNGGHGGPGADGPDADGEAHGGEGGNGGAGSDVTVTWNSQLPAGHPSGFPWRIRAAAQSFAGNGGHGGTGGAGAGGGTIGMGGDGGRGGNAHTSVNALWLAQTLAQGGAGGSASGLGASAGHGGTAWANAALPYDQSLVDSPFGLPPPRPTIQLESRGGRGGDGLRNARAGNGGGVQLGDQFSSLSVATPLAYDLQAFLRGGDGGAAIYGSALTTQSVGSAGQVLPETRGGMGGNAGVNLTNLLRPGGLSQTSQQLNKLHFALRGGDGGAGRIESLAGTAHGGWGGSAGLDAPFLSDGSRAFFGKSGLFLQATGGKGGTAEGALNHGNGGRGGDAHVRGTLQTRPGARIELRLIGGRGGDAGGAGRGGDGGNAGSFNPLITTSQTAFALSSLAGHGGRGTTGGHGGNAVADFFGAAPALDGSNHPVIEARGGWGGYGTTQSGDGGTAFANLRDAVTDRFAGFPFTVIALGGRSNGARQGDARATADVVRLDPGFNAILNVTAGIDDRTGSSAMSLPVAATGGNATATGRLSAATSGASMTVRTEARATGGFGTERSGFARATATAFNSGAGIAEARAIARTQSDPLESTANNATAVTSSFATSGIASASSEAFVQGHFNRASASSSSAGVRSAAEAQAQSNTSAWRHQARVSASATNNQDWIGERRTLDAIAETSYRRGDISTLFAQASSRPEAFSLVTVNPQANIVNELATTPRVKAAFGLPPSVNPWVSQVVAVGFMGGGFPANLAIADDLTTVAVNARMELDFDLVAGVQDQNQLLFGLTGATVIDAGFQSLEFALLYEGATIVQQSFTSSTEANNWFYDRIFDLGDLTPGVDLSKSVVVELDLVTSNRFSGFGFSYILGSGVAPASALRSGFAVSAIPEPGAGLMLVLTGGFATGLRRRRHQTTK